MHSLIQIYRAYKNKLTNKIWGYVHISAQGKKKGDVLLSYITTPFTIAPWQHKTDPHSNYWECAEIARLFCERGYAVDCIAADRHVFIPRKPYAVCIDTQLDLERLSKYLPRSCKKVIHIDNPYYKVYNQREADRLRDLYSRRGAVLAPRRQVPLSESVKVADFLEGFGNESVRETYLQFGKPIFPIPVSIVKEYPFPESKDFDRSRKEFLYFSGGGAVLKGLDLAIEAFVGMPDLHLHIIGPAAFEKDFAAEYRKELSSPNITVYGRPKIDANDLMTVRGQDIKAIFDRCAAIVYPSAAEGTSTAVVQAIRAGLVPIVTPETGLDPKIGGIMLQKPTIESIQQTVRDFSDMSAETIRDMAKNAWSYVNKHHTKKAFSTAYGRFIDDILKL